ncbi:MAG: UvrD-helicase domain-containing protein, partial [Actinomycetota bacterium]
MSEQLDLFGEPHDSTAAGGRPATPDQHDRDLVTDALGTTLFVEAGAGSGKTTALVGRVVNLVLEGVPITGIAAITFTEKAAAELRVRIRERLDATAAALARDHLGYSLAHTALADLDTAPIGTLHAFARRLLNEFPVEVELPPRFEVLDEVQSATAFHERFTDFLEALLDDTASVRLVELCQYDRFGVEKGVRRMAEDFQANWDLVQECVAAEVPPQVDTDTVQRALAASCRAVTGFEPPRGDSQETVRAAFAEFAAAFADELPFGELLRLLELVGKAKAKGNSADWKKHHGSADVLPAFKQAVTDAAELARQTLVRCNEERRLTIGALLRAFTLDSVQARRADGTLEFHDLLVLARRMVAEHEGVRAQLH